MTATLRILSGGAAQALVHALERAGGVRIEGSFGAVGAMKDKLLAGEPCDFVILSDALVRELAAAGHVDAASARPVGVVKTGVAVKAGEPLPRLQDADDLRTLLANASEIYFPDPAKATAGIHFMKVLAALGLAASHAARFRTFPNGTTAIGELARRGPAGAVGCTQVTEIRATEGVQLAGLLPPPHALATTYTAAVTTKSRQPSEAAAFIELLCSPSSADARSNAGFS